MSGHSHFSTIKHKKAATDVKRGKIFSKISKLISVASREKGPDQQTNPKLRLAIEKAKEANMPADNIERAIKKGAGGLEGAQIEEFTYEAYGPQGVALIILGITDNKNRTSSEIKHILSMHDSKMASAGSVMYQFDKKEQEYMPKYPMPITDDKTKQQLEKLFEALDEQDDVKDIYSNADF